MPFTSKRMDFEEMTTLLDKLGLDTRAVTVASEQGKWQSGAFTVSKTGLEGLFTLTIDTRDEPTVEDDTYLITVGETQYPVLMSKTGIHHLYIGTVRAENYLSSHQDYNATLAAAQEHHQNRKEN